MDVAAILNDEGDPIETIIPEEDPRGKLVAFDSDSEEEIIPHSLTQVTKLWTSSLGGLGCFADQNQEIMTGIAAVTGTKISLNEDKKSIKVSGRDTGDVDDALEKLSRMETPLVCHLSIKAAGC